MAGSINGNNTRCPNRSIICVVCVLRLSPVIKAATYSVCAALVMCCLWGAEVSAGEPVAGQAAFRIGGGAKNVIAVCPEEKGSVASFNRRYAGKELAAYLEKITGAAIQVVDKVDDGRIAAGGVIFVGPSQYTDTLKLGRDQYDFGPGGFLIKTIDGNLFLLGHDSGSERRMEDRPLGETGTYYAVATFLEKCCGVRWLWPGELGTVIPKRSSIEIARMDLRSRPSYLSRYNRSSIECQQKLPDGTIKYNQGLRHTQWALFERRHLAGSSISVSAGHYLENYVKADEYEAHSDWFSYYDGKRQPWRKSHGSIRGQVCHSNPEVVQRFADKIVDSFKSMKDDEVGSRFATLTPNDGWLFCVCENCRKMDGDAIPWPMDVSGSGPLPGKVYNEKCGAVSSLSNRIWTFNNQVARKVAERAPEARMACLAYSGYVKPPHDVARVEDNTLVSFCDIYWTVGAPEEYDKGRDYFIAWSKKARHLGVRSYYYYIGSRPHRMAETIRFLANLGCIQHDAEFTQTYGFKWIDMVINQKALWDPQLDVDSLIDDYYAAAYGPGAVAMRQYLDLQEKVSMGYNVYSTFQNPELVCANWTSPVRKELRGCLDDALRATGGTGEHVDRIRFVEEAWEMLDSFCELRAALVSLKRMGVAVPEVPDVNTENADPDTVRKGIEVANLQWQRLKGVMMRGEEKQGWSIPWFTWFVSPDSREGKVIDAWGRVVDNLFGQVCLNGGIALPARWNFRIDPKEEGQKAGWFKPEFRDDDWERMRTDDVWEKQGYGAEKYPDNKGEGYNGKAWYRIRVPVPEERKGRRAWLELGAVDESFTVWVNGEKTGEFHYAEQGDKDAWKKPHRLEITKALKPGAENTIVVEVEDKGGGGGIWKPCFIVFEDVKKK